MIWCAVLVACAVFRPLQMDEIFQLIGVRGPHLGSVFAWLRVNPASVPASYLLEWAMVRAAGASNLVARVPSIAAWALMAPAMARIGARIGLRKPETAAVLAAVTPMLFRYAIEGRPYMAAFCFTAFATLALLAIIGNPGKPGTGTLCVYAALLAAGPMTQGTAVTVTLAHALFVITDGSIRRDRGRQWRLVTAIVASLVLPVAWSLTMRQAWAAAITNNGYAFDGSFRALFGFFKDITGGGVVCTGLLLAGAVFGYSKAEVHGTAKHLLGIIATVAFAGAIASDAAAGYFISPRQAIYCLCGLIPLAAAGWERMRIAQAHTAWLALSLFVAVAVGRDVSVVRSKENWKAASEIVARAVTQGFCVQPASDLNAPLDLYSFFNGSLASHRCTVHDNRVGLIYSTYTPQADRDAAASALRKRGLAVEATESAGGTTVERFTSGH